MKTSCAITLLVIVTMTSTTVAYEQEIKTWHPNPTLTKQHLSGWPTSLTVEIDRLELGGLCLPRIQSLVQNDEVEALNYGNIVLAGDSPGHGHGRGDNAKLL